eukprot:590922-Amphidinium_carterae.2
METVVSAAIDLPSEEEKIAFGSYQTEVQEHLSVCRDAASQMPIALYIVYKIARTGCSQDRQD